MILRRWLWVALALLGLVSLFCVAWWLLSGFPSVTVKSNVSWTKPPGASLDTRIKDAPKFTLSGDIEATKKNRLGLEFETIPITVEEAEKIKKDGKVHIINPFRRSATVSVQITDKDEPFIDDR